MFLKLRTEISSINFKNASWPQIRQSKVVNFVVGELFNSLYTKKFYFIFSLCTLLRSVI